MHRTSHSTRLQDELYRIMLNRAEDDGNGRKEDEDDDEPEIPPG